MYPRTLLALAALALSASAYPAVNSPADAIDAFKQLSFKDLFDSMKQSVVAMDDKDDVCPDLVVRCLKDGDVTQIVGDVSSSTLDRASGAARTVS